MGDRAMRLRGIPGCGLAALTVLMVASVAAPLRAAGVDTDASKALRLRILRLNEVTGTDPMQGEVYVLEADRNVRKLLAFAQRMTREKPQPLNLNATLILATVAANLKKPTETSLAEKFYRLHAEQATQLRSDRSLIQAYLGMIEILYDSKQFDRCEKTCREFLDLKGGKELEIFKDFIDRQRVMALLRMDKIDEAVRAVNALVQRNPDSRSNLELKAHLLREQDKVAEAVKIFETLLLNTKGDDRLRPASRQTLINKYRYMLSGLYTDQNKIDKAADELKELLEKEPNNPTYNNDLGFIWADHDKNLEEAEKLIRKALVEDRKKRKSKGTTSDHDNAAYLDSLGWVLYKQKKYKEALPPLQDAVKEEEGRHIEIYEHLGDVYFALDQKDKALQAWKEGVRVAGKSKRELKRKAEVEKKIKAHE
jgi:tetratricopeptide (TPR) repeat protein